MKARSLISTIGSALIVGMLAAAPAHAGSGTIKTTHATTLYQGTVPPKVQPKVTQKTPEYQVAVMAKAPAQPPVRRSIFIRR
jgi:hypothetical protein